MTDAMQSLEGDPRHHTLNLRRMIDEAASHAREDVKNVDDPKLQALFETAAEVLGGLSKAFEHAEQKSEPAWR